MIESLVSILLDLESNARVKSIHLNFDSFDKGTLSIQVETTAELEREFLGRITVEKKNISELVLSLSLEPNQVSNLEVSSVLLKLKERCEFLSKKISVEYKKEKEFLNVGISPLWRKDSSDTSSQEYIDFYKSLYFKEDSDDVLPWIYIRTYEPVEVKGILFFEEFNPFKVIGEKGKISLLQNQVPVAPSLKDSLLPNFFEGAFGVLELQSNSEDLLLKDKVIEETKSELILNLAHSLARLERKNRQHYESIWKNISYFVKKGCLSNEEFLKVTRSSILYKNLNGELKTISEFLEGTNKSELQRIYYYDKTCTNREILEYAKAHQLDSIEIDSFLDPLFIQFEETKITHDLYNLSFASLEELIVAKGEVNQEKNQECEKVISEIVSPIQNELAKKDMGILNYKIKTFDNNAPEMFVYINESGRRSFYNTRFSTNVDSWPMDLTLVVNSEHSKIKRMLSLSEEERIDYMELLFSKATSHLWSNTPALETIRTKGFYGPHN